MASERDSQLAHLRKLLEQQRFRDALRGYRDLCAGYPYDADLWLERADVAEVGGWIDDAARALFHVVELYAQAGMGEAIEIAERLLALDAEHRGALRFLRANAPERVQRDQPGAGATSRKPASAPVGGDPQVGAVTPETAPASASIPDPIPEPIDDDVIPLVVPGSMSIPVTVPISDSVPMPLPVSDSIAMPRPRPGILSGPVALPRELGGDSGAHRLAPALAALDTGPDQPPRQLAAMLAQLDCPLTAALDSAGIALLAERGALHEVDRGGFIFRQGERGNSVFVVLEGSVDIERYHPVLNTVVRLSTLAAGAFFGEQALIAGGARAATVRARRPSAILEIERGLIRTLGRRHEKLLITLMRYFRARLVGTMMATAPLFHPFSTDERRQLVACFRVRELMEREIVLREGSPGDGLYVLLIGTLIAFVTDRDGKARKLGVLGPGDIFGEMSLLRDAPTMATIATHTRSWILRLPKRDFDAMVAAHPEVLERLNDIASIRDAQNHDVLAHSRDDRDR